MARPMPRLLPVTIAVLLSTRAGQTKYEKDDSMDGQYGGTKLEAGEPSGVDEVD